MKKPWERFKDPQYQAWRNSVLERDKYTCQSCRKVCKKSEKGLAAHHIKEYSKFVELRFDINNGLTLCRVCHMNLHSRPFKVEKIFCACGCRTIIDSKDKYSGRPRKYVNHHSRKGSVVSEKTKNLLSQSRNNISLSQQHKENISKGLKNSTSQIGRKKGTKNLLPIKIDKIRKEEISESRRMEIKLIDPNGNTIIFKGLRKFCRENKLTYSCVSALINKKRDEYIGWKRLE